MTLEKHGFKFPLLLRSPGHHTGHNFNSFERSEDLAAAADALPGDQLYAIEYIDLHGAKTAKYASSASCSSTDISTRCISRSQKIGKCTTFRRTWPTSPNIVRKTNAF